MAARILRAGEGEVLGSPQGCRDRFLVDAKDRGGRFSLLEHLLAPRSIAAPMHRHTEEEAFRIIDTADGDVDLGPLVAPYGCESDIEATLPIIERYGLTFG